LSINAFEDTAKQSCAMVLRWRFFASFLRPVFPASYMQHISDLHPKFALRPHQVQKYGRYQLCDRWDYARKKKDRRQKKKPQSKNIMACPIP